MPYPPTERPLHSLELGEGDTSLITLLQWNVWHRADTGKVLQHLQEICTAEDVDVICLQEFNRENLEDYAKALGMQYAFSRARHLTVAGVPYGKGDDLVIFSRLPFTGPTTEELSKNGYHIFRESEPSQNYLEVTVQLPNNKELTVANVHLLPSAVTKRRSRKAEVDRLAETVNGKEPPYILVGDFNAGKDSYAARRLSSILTPAKTPGTPTWSSNHWVGFPVKRELDEAYISEGVTVEDSRILDAGPSDHNPILTRLRV